RVLGDRRVLLGGGGRRPGGGCTGLGGHDCGEGGLVGGVGLRLLLGGGPVAGAEALHSGGSVLLGLAQLVVLLGLATLFARGLLGVALLALLRPDELGEELEVRRHQWDPIFWRMMFRAPPALNHSICSSLSV